VEMVKCVVVGDGAVGKVLSQNLQDINNDWIPLDLSIDLVRNQQIPQRIYSYGTFSGKLHAAAHLTGLWLA
jgi:hypothetical protein